MKRLRIEHITGFGYEGEVAASYNEARMLPATAVNQFVLSSALEISPTASINSYQDYFGTRVSVFDVLAPHQELSITSRSLVEVHPRPLRPGKTSWEELERRRIAEAELAEFSGQTGRTQPHEEVVALAEEIANTSDTPWQAAHRIAISIGEAIEYQQGVTEVHTTALQSWETRRGVCQDIAHLTLGALRSAGIPARYVSGYLHPHLEPEPGITVSGESHAWVEWFDGENWEGFDPTNGVPIGDRHVLVGYGRDYQDVPPLRGVYAGPFLSQLRVKVNITREL